MAKAEQRKIEIIASGKKFNASFKEMNTSARILSNQLKKLPRGTKEFTDKAKELKRVNKDLARTKKEMFGTRKAMGGVTKMFSPWAIGMAGIVAGLGAAFNKIKDFQQANANLASVLGKTRKQITALTDDAKRLGASTAFTATEVAGLQTEYAKLGFVEGEILNVTEATLMLAAATGSDLAQSASVAGGTLRAFGLDSTETQRVVDVMAKSFSSSALDMQKFTDSMKTVAPIAKAAGQDVEWTTAQLGVLTNNSIDASTAGTSLRNMLLRLSDSGQSWGDAMEEINTSTNKLKTAQDLFGVKASAVALILADQGDEANILEEKLRGAAGAAEKMANEQLNTLQGRITLLSSAWDGFILSIEDGDGVIGSFVNGSLTFLTKALTQLANISNIFELVFTDFADVSEKTKLKILEMGETIEGNKISDIVEEAFSGWTNEEIINGIENSKKAFIEAFVAEGESAEESAILFETFYRQRIKAYWDDVETKKQAIEAAKEADKEALIAEKATEEKRIEKKRMRAVEAAKKIDAETEAAKLALNKKLNAIEFENKSLKINAIKDEQEKEIALIDLQLEKKLEKLNAERADIIDNIYLTAEQKAEALIIINEQESLLEQEATLLKLEVEKANLDERMDALGDYNSKRLAALDKQYNAELKKAKDAEDKKKKIILGAIRIIDKAQQTAFTLHQQNLAAAFDNERVITTDNYATDLLLLREKLDKGILSEDEFKAKKLALDKQQASDLYAIQVKQFESDKKIGLRRIAIDTAIAVAKAFATFGPTPVGFIAAGIATINGIAQALIVNNQKLPPPPAYAEGGYTSIANGGSVRGKQLAWVAEDGEEFVSPNWMVRSPKYANTIMWLENERQLGNRSGYTDGGFTSAPPPLQQPAADGQNFNELTQKFDMLLAETQKTNELIAEWPDVLQVHNNVADTVDKINVINDIERDSMISRAG